MTSKYIETAGDLARCQTSWVHTTTSTFVQSLGYAYSSLFLVSFTLIFMSLFPSILSSNFLRATSIPTFHNLISFLFSTSFPFLPHCYMELSWLFIYSHFSCTVFSFFFFLSLSLFTRCVLLTHWRIPPFKFTHSCLILTRLIIFPD